MYLFRLPLRLVAVPLGILALHSALSAQTSRGAVTGLITDPQKADVPNAKVTLIGLATNVSRTTRTNESGLYRFDAVDSVAYKLTVEATGFHTAVAPQLLVTAAQETTADLMLELGDLRQVVEVSESSESLRVDAPV